MHDLLDVEIQALDSNGDGIARHGRRLLAVPFTIPGEKVRIHVDETRGVATLVDIRVASPHRVPAPCRHFGPCGGCAWQHIAYAEQLRLKTALVERLLRVAVPDAPPVEATMPGADMDAPWGYRQKVHFVFATGRPVKAAADARTDGLVMGHYARGTRRVVPVTECPVHADRGNALAFSLYRQWARAGVEAAGSSGQGRRERRPSAAPGVLRSLAIRVARHTSEIMTTLVISGDTDKRLRGTTKRAIGTPPDASFHLNLHPKPDRFIFGSETRRVSGPARLREELAGTVYLISPTAFFQTNIRAAEVLIELVLAAVPRGATVLDLYAGAGLFALPLARAGHRVVAVEENRAAVADGEASRQFNRIPDDQCRFITRPVEAAIRALPRTDIVILDPPRDGCAPAVLEGICVTLRPRRIVYVSCNPEALARDLATMTGTGYRLVSIQPVDMFPHTAHVETVAVLEGGGRDPGAGIRGPGTGIRAPGSGGRGPGAGHRGPGTGDRAPAGRVGPRSKT